MIDDVASEANGISSVQIKGEISNGIINNQMNQNPSGSVRIKWNS